MESETFFFEHAGWSYDPATETSEQGRLRCAAILAEAETWARDAGVTFTWSDDWSVGSHTFYFGPGSAYEDREPQTCEMVTAELGDCFTSLGCIDDADESYRRVVEAEMALQLRDQVLGSLLSYA